MVKNHKKKAVALVLIVMVITSLSLLLMGSIKVLTRTHTTYTTGMSKNGEININQSRGKFICYRDKNGSLKQKTIRYKTNGDIENIPSLNQTKNGNCVFTIPQQANSFRITLIGAGGGGSNTKATLRTNITPAENGEDSIAMGMNSTTFHELFPNSKYIPSSSVTTALNDFFSNLYIGVKAKNLDPTHRGGSKRERIYNIVSNYSTLKNKTIEHFMSENDITGAKIDSNIKIKQVKNNRDYKVKCYGGVGIHQYPYTNNFDSNFNNQLKYKLFGGTQTSGICNIYDGRTGSYTLSSSTEDYDYSIFFQVEHETGETFTVIPQQAFKFKIKHHEADIYESKAGEPGEITIFESRFIAKSGEDKLTITQNNIGKGGDGGTYTSLNGKTGGTTTLKVTTNVGEQTIRANGGAGGVATLSETLSYYNNIPSQLDMTKEQAYIGENGKSADIIISSDFGLTDLNAGLSEAEVADRDDYIDAATLPGSSGASATMIWNKENSITESAASPYIAFIRPNGSEKPLRSGFSLPSTEGIETSKPYLRHKTAGKGASGAIIIEW